jgi:2-polyprenyl-6-hydroxyphenyl methylase/3-demethylubiquinone-9 3-methyltransferase
MVPAQTHTSRAKSSAPSAGKRNGGGDTVGARPKLSAAIIVLNEEKNLPGLLEQLDWVDEIVVVDGGSSDATVPLARRYTDQVSVRPFRDYAEQRNRAVASCRGEWVLFIDADERPGPGFAGEVRRRIERPRSFAAFRVPIQSSIFGRRFRHSGTQDDRPIRLVRRGQASWSGAVHEVACVEGSVGRLESGLRHETLPTLRAFLAKMDRYTALEANHRHQQGKAPRATELLWRPPLEVFRRLVWKGGLLDGPAGWAFCLLSGLSMAVALLRGRASENNADRLARFLTGHKAWLDRLERWICLPRRRGAPLAERTACGLPAPRTSCVNASERKRRRIEDAVARRFDELAGRFHASIPRDDVRVRALERHLGELAGRRVLDLACGKGRYVDWLQSEGAWAVGVDLSRGMLDAGNGNNGVCARSVRLPFRAGCFDAVCCVEGFSHFPDADGTLAEIARVLRPGGRCVLIDKNAASLDWRRPWLPGLAVKWIDEQRGRWMYPVGYVYCERWSFLPKLLGLVRRRFRRVVSEYLLSPLEERSAGRGLFRLLPPVRHFMVVACDKR